MLHTDHLDIMKKIEKGLEECFNEPVENQIPEVTKKLETVKLEEKQAEEPKETVADKIKSEILSSPELIRENPVGFCKVGQVQFGSPAEASGLRQGDILVSFGYVNHKNHENLSKIRDVVIANEDYPVNIVILRGIDKRELTLTPKKWSGPGLLG